MRVFSTAVALAVLLTWPLVLHPGHLYGSPFGEVDNHFWMFWVTRAGPGPWTNWPDGWPIPLMDPVNRLFAWGPPVLAYDLVVFVNFVLAGLGGYALAREIGGNGWIGLVATEAAPVLAGLADFGITESLPVGWLGLHAAATP